MQTYIIEQKITPLVNRYGIYSTDSDGNKAALVAFAQQKRFAFKEGFTFYKDERKSEPYFTVKAEKVMDIHGKFIVTDAEGSNVGAIRKAFGSSLLRSTYEIIDNMGTVVTTVRESNEAMALLRRIWGFIPFLSELPFIFKYHFEFIDLNSNSDLGQYVKTTLLRDHYRLSIDNTLLQKVGEPTIFAQAILLDALQGR